MGTRAIVASTTTNKGSNRSSRNTRLRVYLSITVVAVLAWGAAFLAPASRFWDDWVVGYDTLQNARELGLPWIGYILAALSAMGIWTFKVVALGATVVVGCATYEISGRGLGLNSRERLLLAMLVVALPLNTARTIAILDTYMWSLALFFVAWYLLVGGDTSSPGRARYLVATLLLYVSYTTASLLLFTALPIAHLAFLSVRRDVPLWEGVPRFVVRFWYLFLAPIIFWVVRTLFLQPFGVYKSYNVPGLVGGSSNPVTAATLILSATLVFVVLVLVFWLIAASSRHAGTVRNLCLGMLAVTTGAMGWFLLQNRASVTLAALVVPVTLLLCAPVLIWTAVFPVALDRTPGGTNVVESGDRNVTPLLAVGLIALILALLPYLLVGKLPSFQLWETRHQLLMPLGVGIIIVAAVRALSKNVSQPVVRVVALGLITVFAFVSLTISVRLVADYRKQVQVIEALAKEPLVRRASIVVFSDQAPDLNYDSRGFQFYEYNGWLTGAFGNHSRLGIDETSTRHFLNGNFNRFKVNATHYGFGEYRKPKHGVLVQIVPLERASWWTLIAGEPSVRLRVTPIDNWANLAAEGNRLRLARSTVGL